MGDEWLLNAFKGEERNMKLRYWRVKFPLAFSSRFNVIINVPEDKGTWGAILESLRELLAEVNGFRLWVLGTQSSYDINLEDELLDLSDKLYESFSGKLTLLRPLIRELREEGGKVLILSDRDPVDLDDWREKVSGWQRIEPRAKIERLFQSGMESKGLVIKGRALLPLRVDLEGDTLIEEIDEKLYQISYEDGAYLLRLNLSPKLVTTLHFEALALEKPKLISSSGELLEGIEEMRWFSQITWSPLPDSLAEIISQISEENRYLCPYCGDYHSGDTTICPTGAVIFGGFPLGVPTLIKKLEGTWEYLPLSKVIAYPLELEDGSWIAIFRDGTISKFEGDRWLQKGKLKRGVNKLSGELFAILNTL